MSIDLSDKETREKLEREQARHIAYLEKWGGSLPRFLGVPIGMAFTYELIQPMNNVYLQSLLESEEE